MKVLGLDHVQVAMPVGGEDAARGFYGLLLGLREIAKPASLAGRGGVWFQCGALELHLGAEADFRPARKAHPALRVQQFDELVSLLTTAGVEVRDDVSIPAVRRAFVFDPFGNRVELVAHEV